MIAWLQRHAPTVAAFESALREPRRAQETRLTAYLEANAATVFAREHGFGSIRSLDAFRDAVPIRPPSAVEPWITRSAAGEEAVLTREPVIAFEETSGTSGASKLIPYTAGLQREFERAAVCWFTSLQRNTPEALAGKAYWSLSPPVKPSWTTPGGIPVGFGHDLAYFPAETARALAETMAVQPGGAAAHDADAFWNATVDQLLACDDLTLVSVWSPVFFLRLDEQLRHRLPNDWTWRDRWPRLALLSCWTDAQSAAWIPAVRERLGDVPIEGKGLLSTEGIVSVPWEGGVPTLAVTAHFVEFLDERGKAWLADEVTIGERYEVVLTTAGGLYRYRTGDRVEVTGWTEHTPTLRFIGRTGRVSDLVGEKLSEEQAIAAADTVPGLRFLAATAKGYVAVFDGPPHPLDEVEAHLARNPYYRQAVALGQLAPLHAISLSPGQIAHLLEGFRELQRCALGDVKIPGLVQKNEWESLQSRLISAGDSMAASP